MSFALPARRELGGISGLMLSFTALFVCCYGGASALSAFVPWRLSVDFPFEQAIPFLPAASIVYLSMDVLLLLAPFIFHTAAKLWPLIAALSFQTLLASACFILLPVETHFPPRQVVGDHAVAFAIADLLNLERNFLPSLHVSFSVTAALAYGSRFKLVGEVAFAVWALAIAASTLLIHEHHVIDVLAGALLGGFSWKKVAAWTARAEVREAFRVEWLCLKNTLLFSKRHLRYAVIGIALLRASVPHFRRRRALRTGFCFLQLVDDLLDDDRPCNEDPLELTDRVLRSMGSRQFSSSELEQLGKAFTEDILAAGGPRALQLAEDLIRVMQRDRQRVLERRLLSAHQLLEHHRDTFGPSLDLMLIAGGSSLRAADVPELVDALGWCSTVRDLEEDLQRQLINIPAPVVHAAEQEDLPLLTSAAVNSWLGAELERARRLLEALERRLAALGSGRDVRVLVMFARSVRRYAA